MKEYSETTKKVVTMAIVGAIIMTAVILITKSYEPKEVIIQQKKEDSVKYEVIMMSYEEFQKYNEPQVTSKTEITTNSETTVEIIEE